MTALLKDLPLFLLRRKLPVSFLENKPKKILIKDNVIRKTGYPARKTFVHPLRHSCFLHEAIPLDMAIGIRPIPIGSPVSPIPTLPVLPAIFPGRYGLGAAGFDAFRGGLGRVGNG